MFGRGSDFEKVECNGTTRFVLRKVADIGKAFSFYAPEIDFGFKASLNLAQSVLDGGAEGNFKKKTEQIFEELDRIHIDALAKFSMHYNLFRMDPCNVNAYNDFRAAITEISKSIDTLRGLQNKMEDLKEKRLGSGDTVNTRGIDRLIGELGSYYKPTD